MAVEAFVGVLFGAVAGAITFSKIARIQSIAQVKFSDPMCIRYGTGVMQPNDTTDDDDNDDDNDDGLSKKDTIDLPCPVLEFRLVNLLNGEKGGEIVNASVNVVASILVADDESEKRAGQRQSVSKKHKQRTSIVGKATHKTAKRAMQASVASTKAVKTGVRTGTLAAKQTGAALFGVGKKATLATGSLIQQLNKQILKTSKHHAVDGDNVEAEPYNEKEEQELEKELEDLFAARFVEKLEREHGAVSMLAEANKASVAVDEGNAQLAPPRAFYKLEVRTMRRGPG